MASKMNLTIEFAGGCELLFSSQRQIKLELPNDKPFTIRDLLAHMVANHLKERPEMFVQGENIRPGILIVVNQVDSEVIGHLDYKLENDDTVLFISTLHGG